MNPVEPKLAEDCGSLSDAPHEAVFFLQMGAGDLQQHQYSFGIIDHSSHGSRKDPMVLKGNELDEVHGIHKSYGIPQFR